MSEIKTIGDVRKVLSRHRDWLEDMSTEAQMSTDEFENKICGYL